MPESPKILCIVGARPNLMKMAPILRAFRSAAHPANTPLVHTGQHYDRALNQRFFEDLNLPWPDVNLEVGSGSHVVQTAQGRCWRPRNPLRFWLSGTSIPPWPARSLR